MARCECFVVAIHAVRKNVRDVFLGKGPAGDYARSACMVVKHYVVECLQVRDAQPRLVWRGAHVKGRRVHKRWLRAVAERADACGLQFPISSQYITDAMDDGTGSSSKFVVGANCKGTRAEKHLHEAVE